jgi:hypothetical protein
MPKWDIDRNLKLLEPESAPGTIVQRCIVDVKLLVNTDTKARYGNIVPTSEEIERGHLLLWSLGIGYAGQPKSFFYARTIRKAFLQARKAAKASQLSEHTTWGWQAFTPSLSKAKKPSRQSSKSQTVSPEKQPD